MEVQWGGGLGGRDDIIDKTELSNNNVSAKDNLALPGGAPRECTKGKAGGRAGRGHP